MVLSIIGVVVVEYSVKVRNINKVVKIKGKEKKLLEDVSFDVDENNFVAIVGASGAGKTTLLNILGGYDTNNGGEVYINNEPYSLNQNYFRNKIGYVPQKEILHNHLTLESALTYSAKLKINNVKDVTINNKVKKVIKELELNGKEKTYIKNLSGGEKKRAAIAMELLNKPEILLLDEPTSGLDSNIEKKLMRTLRSIADEGKTIIITAHTVSNLYLCDKIIFMSEGGKICFVGSYEESLKYFKVKEFVDIYEKLKDPDAAMYYQNKYKKIPLSDIILKKKRKRVEKDNRISMLKEIKLLSKRYAEIILNNHFFCFLLFFQAVIMGLAVDIVAKSDWLKVYDNAKILLFAFSCAAMWLGLFNSVQEIVKERDIIKLEYFNKMRLSSYIISKLIVFGVVAIIQTLLWLIIISLKVDFPSEGIIFQSAFLEYALCFFLVTFSSSMLGMLISSLVKTCEITLIITPIYMMFQLLFSGILVSLEGIGEKISHLIIGRYAIEAFGTTTNLIQVLKTTALGGIISPEVTTQMFINEAEKYYEYSVGHMSFLLVVLVATIIVFMVLSIMFIRCNIKKSN